MRAAAAVFQCKECISLCAGNIFTVSSRKIKKGKKKNVGNKKTCCNEPCEAVHNQITGGSIFQRFESQDIASILGCTWLTV